MRLSGRFKVHSCLQVDPFSSVSAAHEIGENVSREIQRLHPEIAEVFVHIGTVDFSHICMC